MDMRPQPILLRNSKIEIDEPNFDNITNIIFSKVSSPDDYDYYKSEIKELVNKIFEHVENGNNISSQELNHATYKNLGNISCYNNETPGLYYYINICMCSNKYYLKIYDEHKIIPIPTELGQEIETYLK